MKKSIILFLTIEGCILTGLAIGVISSNLMGYTVDNDVIILSFSIASFSSWLGVVVSKSQNNKI